MFQLKDNEEKDGKVRSSYFQTEFTVSYNERKDGKNNNNAHNVVSEKFDSQGKKNISVQAGRNIIGQEEIPKERKKWIRPPLVGQASTSTEVVFPVQQDIQIETDDEIIETSHRCVESTIFSGRSDYRNRKDYQIEKPPEGGSVEQTVSTNLNQNIEYVKSASPTSSVTSSRPLEWDSGADVGYFQCQDAELSTLERLALQRGSASLLTRSDPEGTTSSAGKPIVTTVGRPTAESTPVNTLPRKNNEVSDKEDYYPLFPEVIVEEHGQISDSDIENKKEREFIFKKSNSLEIVTELKPEDGPATFPRSQSQSVFTVNMNPQLQKILANTKSNSSSSVATVVKGKKKAVSNNSPNSEITVGDRANSFEYLPGHIYENKSNEIEFVGGDLKADVERGVQLLTEFVKGSNANNTILKKELLQRVVEGLISAEYLSDTELSPRLQRCVTRRSHNRDISGESSSVDNIISKRSDKDGTTGNSTVSSRQNTNSSTQITSESRNSEPLFRYEKIPLEKIRKVSSTNESKDSENSRTSKSLEHDKPNNNWKDPVTKSEKLLEAKKTRGKNSTFDPKLLQYLCSERENQIEWIKKEINHLNNLKQLLEKHECLRKNFATLKKSKQRTQSADVIRTMRQSRRKTEAVTVRHSEPTVKLQNSNKSQENNVESDYNSHNYETDRGDGIIRRNASTETRNWHVTSSCKPQSSTSSLAYTILFEPMKDKENLNIEEEKPIADRETLLKKSRHKIREQFSKLSLQHELQSKRPDYIARAEERRQIVAELTAIRELRQQHKTNVLAAAVSETDKETLFKKIPPYPLALKRVTSQKAMRNLTEKKYRQTYEVKRKQLENRRKEDYRTNRLMADVFKKKLLKRTLKGETDLSNSVNIISSSV